ncbi:MAG: RelA/SpoT domain-containing protein [Clostridium sp.]|nr:RelA/SpoT domain-containing protein [Clostridium sp.]
MSNEKQNIWFPDVAPILYRGVGSLVQVQRLYLDKVMSEADKLRGNTFIPNYLDMYHTKLANYLTKYYNYESLSELEKEIIELKRFLSSLKVPCSISGRLKNYVALLEKVRSFIYDGLDPYSINDELGFRLIVGTKRYDDEESIKQLYDVANKVIAFFVIRKDYQLIKPSPANGLGFNPELFPKIFVPQKGLIYPEYTKYVKDYFIAPKKKGYQALHMVFLTKTGLTIEVQLRTFASHFHAEYISTHMLHKDERYGIDESKVTPEEKEAEEKRQAAIKVVFDPEKVKLDSYYSENGKTLDLIGLQETIRDPFNNFYVA